MLRGPLNTPTVGQAVSVELRDGEVVSGVYRGWIRDVTTGAIRHRVGDGRRRREVGDREIASVTA